MSKLSKSKLGCIPIREVNINSTDAPEIAHLLPLDAKSKKEQNGKTCWEKLTANIKKILCVHPVRVLHPVCLRSVITMDQVREMILAKGNTQTQQPDMSKYLDINIPVIVMNDMTDQMKEIILELTFSRHFSLKDSKLGDLVHGKTMIGLYIWMCSYCFFQAGSDDQMFWDRFAYIASQITFMWTDVMAIMTTVQHLRDDGTHLVRLMDKHVLEVQLDIEERKFRRKKSAMDKMKHFDSLKTDMAWGENRADLSQSRSQRILYSPVNSKARQPFYSQWLSFELLETKTQLKYVHEILTYIELFIDPIVPLLTKLKETTAEIQQSTNLSPNSEIDVILGMIILDKLDLLTLAVKTLKLHVKEIRTIAHVCYEYCRYLHKLEDTKSFAEIERETISLIRKGNVIEEPGLTTYEASVKFNTEPYPEILQCVPLYTAQFTMILQDLKDVFDLDALSTTNENDM